MQDAEKGKTPLMQQPSVNYNPEVRVLKTVSVFAGQASDDGMIDSRKENFMECQTVEETTARWGVTARQVRALRTYR